MSLLVPMVVFFAPGCNNHILLDSCQPDLVRFEGFFNGFQSAMIYCNKACEAYAPEHSSGHKINDYKMCTLSQWEEWLRVQNEVQLSLF